MAQGNVIVWTPTSTQNVSATTGPATMVTKRTKRQRLGQHFLAHPQLAEKIVRLAQIDNADIVLEIGPGRGILTEPLMARCRKLIIVEYDKKLAADLRKKFPISTGVDIYPEDILKFDLNEHLARYRPPKLKVVSNLPYSISTETIFRLIEHSHLFSELWLMVQKEVADRLQAEPGGKDYGILTILTQLYSETRSVLKVPPGAFTPPPKVESSVVSMQLSEEPKIALTDTDLFEKLVRQAFNQRRKMIRNSLKGMEEAMESVGIDLQARPETVTLQQYAKLANFISK